MDTKKRVAVYGLYVCKMRKYIEEESAIIVLHAFITSILDSCNSLLYGLPQHLLSRLQSVKIRQLELLHVLGNLIAWPLSYIKLHWLPVRHHIVYKILSLLYKAINGTVSCHICDLFDYRNSKGTLRSSSQYPLATPKARLKTCGERTFAVAGPGLWNSIPLELRSGSSIDSFKRHFKTYLFNKQQTYCLFLYIDIEICFSFPSFF